MGSTVDGALVVCLRPIAPKGKEKKVAGTNLPDVTETAASCSPLPIHLNGNKRGAAGEDPSIACEARMLPHWPDHVRQLSSCAGFRPCQRRKQYETASTMGRGGRSL